MHQWTNKFFFFFLVKSKSWFQKYSKVCWSVENGRTLYEREYFKPTQPKMSFPLSRRHTFHHNLWFLKRISMLNRVANLRKIEREREEMCSWEREREKECKFLCLKWFWSVENCHPRERIRWSIHCLFSHLKFTKLGRLEIKGKLMKGHMNRKSSLYLE